MACQYLFKMSDVATLIVCIMRQFIIFRDIMVRPAGGAFKLSHCATRNVDQFIFATVITFVLCKSIHISTPY